MADEPQYIQSPPQHKKDQQAISFEHFRKKKWYPQYQGPNEILADIPQKPGRHWNNLQYKISLTSKEESFDEFFNSFGQEKDAQVSDHRVNLVLGANHI